MRRAQITSQKYPQHCPEFHDNSSGRPSPEPLSGTEKEHKPKHLSPDISGGVGVFHVKGWGPKSSVCPSTTGKSNFWGGISRDFAGISRRCPKKFEKKKVCVQFSTPTLLKKEAARAVLRGENSGNALEASKALNFRVWGIPAVLSRGLPGNALRAFPGSFFCGISPENPSRTGGMAQLYCSVEPSPYRTWCRENAGKRADMYQILSKTS